MVSIMKNQEAYRLKSKEESSYKKAENRQLLSNLEEALLSLKKNMS